MAPLIETSVLIPITDNSGQLFERRVWDDLERRLFRFGGLTIPAAVKGQWRQNRRTYQDQSREYVVCLRSWRKLSEWLAIVEWACDTFRQEAIFIRVAGIPEVLNKRRRRAP